MREGGQLLDIAGHLPALLDVTRVRSTAGFLLSELPVLVADLIAETRCGCHELITRITCESGTSSVISGAGGGLTGSFRRPKHVTI